MPCFRTCLTCMSRSQAPLCHCTRRLIANQPEGTFGHLRYSLGGDRPSQTTRLPLSPARIYGSGLEPRHEQGGISTLPPRWLTPPLPRLPPILHNPYQDPTSSCSKGPRGLSVLSQLPSIFTRTSISPGQWLRQQESRCAIRAGRNLPDKEFRWNLLLEDRLRLHTSQTAGWSFPPTSLRRRRVRTISSSSRGSGKRAGVWSLRI